MESIRKRSHRERWLQSLVRGEGGGPQDRPGGPGVDLYYNQLNIKAEREGIEPTKPLARPQRF